MNMCGENCVQLFGERLPIWYDFRPLLTLLLLTLGMLLFYVLYMAIDQPSCTVCNE